MEEVVKPNTTENMVLAYEMEPGKDVRYSCPRQKNCDPARFWCILYRHVYSYESPDADRVEQRLKQIRFETAYRSGR